MEVFSTLLGPSNAIVGLKGRGFPSSCRDHGVMPSSLGVMKMPRRTQKIEAVMTASRPPVVPDLHPLYRSKSAVFDYKRMEEEEEEQKKRKDSVTAEKLDQWIRDSIGEIVRNIGEAPFLVQIFSQGHSVLRLEREEALPESWPIVKKRWDQSSCMPDGVILVEELKDEEEEEAANDNTNDDAKNQGGSSRTWGLVVQGRGMDCAASCYILNTCRVRSSAGFSRENCSRISDASCKELNPRITGNCRLLNLIF